MNSGCVPSSSWNRKCNDNSSLRAESAKLIKSETVDRISEAKTPYITKVAVAAMEELLQMAQMEEPLWLPGPKPQGSGPNVLNEEEYMRRFPKSKTEGIKTEASRENVVVIMNHINLVKILMNVNHWSSLFSSIVSTALTLDVLSTGVAGNLNGAMQMIYAEFQVPSPLVPTRDCYFVRYCTQIVDGIWAIVDVSLDHTPAARCQKRPSGCLIQEMPNGYSKVTWIEHIEVDDESIHYVYEPLVNSGLAFGAKRWIATLDRQCKRLASAMPGNLPQNDICHMHQEGRRRVLKLAERMIISYCSGVSATTTHQWTTLMGSGYDTNDVRVMTRQSIDDLGRPHGILMNASTSLWLPISPNIVFDFLRDVKSRSQWDILSNEGDIQEVAHIANGRETDNRVSVLRVKSLNSAQKSMLMLQESNTDPTGSFIVYAPIDVPTVNIILCGGNPDNVELLPSGFAILPDVPSCNTNCIIAGAGGSLLTIAFQILVNRISTAKLSLESIATINNLISCTINKIKVAFYLRLPD